MKYIVFFILFTISLEAFEIQIEKENTPIFKEYSGYRELNIEPLIDDLYVAIAYSEEYRPVGLEIQRIHILIGNKKIIGYQVSSIYSSKAKPNVSHYAPNMKLFLSRIPGEIIDFIISLKTH